MTSGRNEAPRGSDGSQSLCTQMWRNVKEVKRFLAFSFVFWVTKLKKTRRGYGAPTVRGYGVLCGCTVESRRRAQA